MEIYIRLDSNTKLFLITEQEFEKINAQNKEQVRKLILDLNALPRYKLAFVLSQWVFVLFILSGPCFFLLYFSVYLIILPAFFILMFIVTICVTSSYISKFYRNVEKVCQIYRPLLRTVYIIDNKVSQDGVNRYYRNFICLRSLNRFPAENTKDLNLTIPIFQFTPGQEGLQVKMSPEVSPNGKTYKNIDKFESNTNFGYSPIQQVTTEGNHVLLTQLDSYKNELPVDAYKIPIFRDDIQKPVRPDEPFR